MRIILFTGKGGVGKSTVAAGTAALAAGTAALAAADGLRSLVLSTDAAHSLADAFGVELGAEPVLVAPDRACSRSSSSASTSSAPGITVISSAAIGSTPATSSTESR